MAFKASDVVQGAVQRLFGNANRVFGGVTSSPVNDPAKSEQSLKRSVSVLRRLIPSSFMARALVILGSGLGELASSITKQTWVAYDDVPFLHGSTAPGHVGRFVAGSVDDVPILCMQGRLHGYEGYSPFEVTYPIRIAGLLGIKNVILTNASGGINPLLEPGQVVLINDHINLTGMNPLVGPNNDRFGIRFPDMSDAYSSQLRSYAHEAAREIGYDLVESVYLGVSGPSFETPAEIRAFSRLGADVVGMSTVWETIVAAHCGMNVLSFSMVTNKAAGISEVPISIDDIERASHVGSTTMDALVRGVLRRL